MNPQFTIAGHQIGGSARCFIIAEAGVNHNGDLQRAIDLIGVAARSGADAVKFQTFDAGRLALRDAPKTKYQVENTGLQESQYEMLAKLQLSASDHLALVEECQKHGILFLSTPFDEQSADLLASMDIAAFKTPSGELTNLPYLTHVAKLGKPVIASTGMATLSEVDAAVRAIAASGATELALLQCVSNYPADPSEVNLRAMASMKAAFGVPVGYSDHTLGIEIAVAAVALGAPIVEKHFTLDRNLPGPDHRASLVPDELTMMVRQIRSVESALGDGVKRPQPSERDTAQSVRKSIVITKALDAGATLTADNVGASRPGTGLSPALLPDVLGRSARVPIPAGTILAWEMLS